MKRTEHRPRSEPASDSDTGGPEGARAAAPRGSPQTGRKRRTAPAWASCGMKNVYVNVGVMAVPNLTKPNIGGGRT
jgi:hypothetical protein